MRQAPARRTVTRETRPTATVEPRTGCALLVIAAFEGWNDAGDAASGAIEHLERAWDADAVAALDPEDYYDFQVNRPIV